MAEIVLDAAIGMKGADLATIQSHQVVVLNPGDRTAHVVLHGVEGADARDGAVVGILDLDSGLEHAVVLGRVESGHVFCSLSVVKCCDRTIV